MHVLLALSLLAQTTPPPADSLLAAAPLSVDTLRAEGGPEVLWRGEASPLVAIRLSAPLPADLPTGSAELLQELARPAAAARADAFGARLSFRVERDAAVIAVTGPAAAFDALVGVLRTAVGEPDLSVGALRTARVRAEDRVLARLERPEPRLRALVAAELTGAPATGPAGTRLDPEALRLLRARLFDPGRLTAVLVGDLPPEVVRSAFTGWERPVGAGRLPRPASLPPLPAAQAHHAWAALAYPVTADPAVLAVAAALVERRVRSAGLRGGAAEAWWSLPGSALVLLGGAAPGDPAVAGAARITEFPEGTAAAPLPRYLRRLVAEAAALAGPRAVAEAAASLRRSVLVEARTAEGRAAVIARFAPVGGADAFLDSLGRVRLEDVRAVLGQALASRPTLVEVRR